MAIKSIEELQQNKIVIDLTGPQGNAFFLLGTADKLMKQMSKTKEERETVLEDMKSSDYEHLLEVFDEHFGDFVDMYR